MSKGQRRQVTDIWGVIHPADSLRFESEAVPRHRAHLRRPAQGNVRAEDVSCDAGADAVRGRARLHRQFRSTAWAPTTDRRRSTTSSWQNLGDAGLPDRILWHKAVADETRRTTTSAQRGRSTAPRPERPERSMGALLFHPGVLLSAAVAQLPAATTTAWTRSGGTSSGWAGRSASTTARSSNVDNAHLLEGKLLLILPELDTNVDPSSTMQVVDALIDADKDFDFLMVPGADHGSGGAYGARKRNDFFVEHLLGVEPPDWNRVAN